MRTVPPHSAARSPEVAAALRVGDAVYIHDSRWKVTKWLGEGGVAVVWQVEHDGQARALRLLKEPAHQALFLDGADMQASAAAAGLALSAETFKQGLVICYQQGRRTPPCQVLPVATGSLADEAHAASPAAREGAALKALVDALGLAQTLHDGGLLHGDLTLRNIVRVGQNELRLIDFDAAERLDAPPRQGGAVPRNVPPSRREWLIGTRAPPNQDERRAWDVAALTRHAVDLAPELSSKPGIRAAVRATPPYRSASQVADALRPLITRAETQPAPAPQAAPRSRAPWLLALPLIVALTAAAVGHASASSAHASYYGPNVLGRSYDFVVEADLERLGVERELAVLHLQAWLGFLLAPWDTERAALVFQAERQRCALHVHRRACMRADALARWAPPIHVVRLYEHAAYCGKSQAHPRPDPEAWHGAIDAWEASAADATSVAWAQRARARAYVASGQRDAALEALDRSSQGARAIGDRALLKRNVDLRTQLRGDHR